MGCKPLKCSGTVLSFIVIASALIAFLPGLPPHIHFEPYTVTPSVDLDKLPRVNVLDRAEEILTGQISGPESIVVFDDGEGVYLGLENGTIVKYHRGELTTVAQVGQDCGNPLGLVCGRPLGMRMDSSGKLIVAAADYGIVKVEPKSGKVQKLFDVQAKIQGVAPSFADDLDVDQNGTIYWSDFASGFEMMKALEGFLGNDRTGRLIKFDPKTKKNTVLIDGLHLANGVQLSSDGEFVLITESIPSRILRYHIKGVKKGKHDIFMDGLPGVPDNIRSNGKGGYYVMLNTPRQFFIDTLGSVPFARKFILRVQNLFLNAFIFIQGIVPENVYTPEISKFVSNLIARDTLIDIFSGPSRVLDVDANGKILRVLQHSQDKIKIASQFTISKKYAYVTNVLSNKIWRLKMSDLN